MIEQAHSLWSTITQCCTDWEITMLSVLTKAGPYSASVELKPAENMQAGHGSLRDTAFVAPAFARAKRQSSS